AGQTFDVTAEHPGLSEQITEVTPELLPVNEALARFPVPVKLPTFLPEGFRMEETARLYLGFADYPDTLELLYSTVLSDSGNISLRAFPESEISGSIVGTDSMEEVVINETLNGALVKGGWFENTRQWEDLDQWSLYWLQEGVRYSLTGADPEVLIAVATSLE
ncbi:MAG: hypothetical protein WBI14_07770, partial [Anaerolineaceae bacterium]